MLQFDVHFIKFSGAVFEIWHPWPPFLGQNWFIFIEFIKLAKIICENHNIYFLLYSVSLKCWNYPKSVCQPCKNFVKFFCLKFFIESYLMKEMYIFCDLRPLSACFLHFSKHIKNCNFDPIFKQLICTFQSKRG